MTAKPRTTTTAALGQILILFFLARIFAGCTVGPNYHPPKTNVPSQWVSPGVGGETNSPTADAHWWKSFHDPELDSLIVRAAQSNLNLRAAVARVREARASARMAYAQYWPTIDANASYTSQRYSANGYPTFPPPFPLQADVYQTGFDASWELDVFGGTRRSVQAAHAQVAATEFDRRNVMITVFAEVARSYVEARAYQRRLTVAAANIKTEQQVLELTRSLFSRGLVGNLDVQQSEALLETTQAATPSLENGFRASVYQLALLLGQPPGAVLDEMSKATPIPLAPPSVPVGLPSDLVQRRPDVRAAERQLAAATARVGVAVADLYPKFSLTGNAGLQSVSLGDWFTAGSRFWTAGPMVQWRIFDAGSIRANIRLQKARVEESLADYEQSMVSAFSDVETSLTAYAKEQTRRESLARAAQANERGVSLANDLYRHGLADFLRVLETQRSLYQSEDALIVSESAVSTDLISLYKALGGGWQDSPNPQPKAL